MQSCDRLFREDCVSEHRADVADFSGLCGFKIQKEGSRQQSIDVGHRFSFTPRLAGVSVLPAGFLK
jgi:hypothetical protein